MTMAITFRLKVHLKTPCLNMMSAITSNCLLLSALAQLLTCMVGYLRSSLRGSHTCHRWPCCSSQSTPRYRSVSTCLHPSLLRSRRWWEPSSCENTWPWSSHPPPAPSEPEEHKQEKQKVTSLLHLRAKFRFTLTVAKLHWYINYSTIGCFFIPLC